MIKVVRVLVVIAFFSLPATGYAASASPPSPESDGMVLIPAGNFLMGSGPEKGASGLDYGVDEEPEHKVFLKAFYIDRYEVAIGEYKKFLDATGRTWIGDANYPDQYPPEIYFYSKERDRYPVNYTTWDDANDYCAWKGKRLPTEAEWEKAARGTDGRSYPWGNQYDARKANTEDAGLGSSAPVGNFPEDKSPFGLYDTAGNLLEWTRSYYLPYEGSTLKDGRWTTGAYVLKGGSFLLQGKLFARPARRSIAYPGYSHRMHGFRCVKDAATE